MNKHILVLDYLYALESGGDGVVFEGYVATKSELELELGVDDVSMKELDIFVEGCLVSYDDLDEDLEEI